MFPIYESYCTSSFIYSSPLGYLKTKTSLRVFSQIINNSIYISGPHLYASVSLCSVQIPSKHS
jgi:hypothetical protein